MNLFKIKDLNRYIKQEEVNKWKIEDLQKLMKNLYVKIAEKKQKNQAIHVETIAHIVYILNMQIKIQEIDGEECHGDLEPVSLEIDSKKGYVIIYRCKKCGAIRKNKAAKDDNMDLIIELSSKQI